MGCNQSTLKNAMPATQDPVVQSISILKQQKAAAAVAPAAPREAVPAATIAADPAPAVVTAEAPIAVEATATAVQIPIAAEKSAAEICADLPVAAADVPEEQSIEIAEPAPVTPAAQIEAVAPTPASPVRAAFGARSTNAACEPPVQEAKSVPSFGEFLAAQQSAAAAADIENARVAAAPAAKKKVLFDQETMRRSAPRFVPAPAASLSKKQKELVRKGHVSQGRRGPVAPKGSKGAIAQMQSEKYLEMAAAFERLLTNAATMNAHLDTR
jgi:hypothetical protein